MSKIKLTGDTSGYVEISAPNVAANNTLELGGGTKILTNLDNVFTGVTTYSGNIDLNANLDLDDNNKILLGTGDDIEIFHNGTDSFVRDVGTGSLYIDSTSGEVVLRVNDTENAVVCRQNAEVELYHNGSQKFETNSDGVNITGDLECDTLDVDGTSVFMPGSDNSINVAIFTGGDTARGLKLGTKGYNGYNDGGVVYNAQTGGTSGSHHFQVNNGIDMVKIDHHGLKFGSDTAYANALDDYEEGTWTPHLYVGSTQQSLDVSYGVYRKIGSLLFIKCHVSCNGAPSGTGALQIRNLPIAQASGGLSQTALSVQWSGTLNRHGVYANTWTTGNIIQLNYSTASGNTGNLQHSDIAANSNFGIAGCYDV